MNYMLSSVLYMMMSNLQVFSKRFMDPEEEELKKIIEAKKPYYDNSI